MGMITKIVLEHPILKQQALERLSMKIDITDWLLAMMTTSAIFKNSLIIITASTMTSLISSGLNLSQYYDDFQYEYCNNIDCIKRSAFEKDAVAPSMEIGTSLYYIPLYFTNRDGQSIIHITKEVVFTKMVHMIFTKGHPLFGQCQRIILQSVQNGWFVKTMNDLKTSVKVRKFELHRERKISFENVAFIFICWGCGLVSATLVFCFELMSQYITYNHK
ncbi:hypothetical protein GWI33_009882 [Rhynchophorus ferrugineus]|uniref:Uncharacterized protein n=1 Tax=Rhynchophorus ferrugineus TaxID=354439 RepID=A0A834ICT6_RHYFE|nr:hypothetical protein GWI33_009882 [Rhynchophorus ferrugineus]